MFLLTKISRSEIVSNQDAFNTNNHPFSALPPALQISEGRPKPPGSPEYISSLTSTCYSRFRQLISSLQVPPQHPITTVILSHRLCRIMCDCLRVRLLTGRLPASEYEDVLELMTPLLQPHFQEKKRWFARLDKVSPKDGEGKMGPFFEPEEVVRSLCSSLRAYKALLRVVEGEVGGEQRSSGGAILHLVPWRDDINTNNEWRVYVPTNRKVRAISQYSERDVGWKEGQMGALVKCLLEGVDKFMQKAGEMNVGLPEEGIVLDLHVKEAKGERGGWVAEPIEVNGFGAQTASGSGLFNWLEDWTRLYGEEEVMEVRIVGGEERRTIRLEYEKDAELRSG